NAVYIESLHQRGDDNTAYRRVNLHFYFPNANGRTLFAENAKTLGFAIGKTDYIPEREPSYYIVLHAISPLEQEAVTELTTKAIYAAETYGGVMEHFDSAFIQKRGIFG
ncbi:MAG: ribonuclease E inhibitor RraB, partial [Eubacteriales bacterium]|nr:ribonuclease E inhibitor RraB [Eubacteriales bacterium]